MSGFTIYGVRLIDDREIRYVGFTRFTPQERLRSHIADTTYGTPGRIFRQWLLLNADKVEAVTICKAETKADARAMEKGAIGACLQTGQRLFNSDHVPSHLRVVALSRAA